MCVDPALFAHPIAVDAELQFGVLRCTLKSTPLASLAHWPQLHRVDLRLLDESLLIRVQKSIPQRRSTRGYSLAAMCIRTDCLIVCMCFVKIGPNVSIGAGTVIGKGVRVTNSVVLEGVLLKVCVQIDNHNNV